MRATKTWGGCACNCGEQIIAGSHFIIVGGEMYLPGHETRNALEDAGLTIRRDYTKITKPTRQQKSVFDLPLFERIEAEQLCIL
jgi:hypothetical protein